jgi:hypothetical protein
MLTLGVLWTLDNLRLLDADRVLEWWPLVLVGVGLSKLVGAAHPRPFAAFLWIGIGAWLLAHNLGYVDWGIWDLWPVILVLVGGSIVVRSLRGPGTRTGGATLPAAGAAGAPADSPDWSEADTFSCTAVWSKVDRRLASQAFRGGDCTAVMGGGEVNLRGARPAPGGAVIDVLVLMGGVEIFVPEDWHVVNEVSAIMGAVEDARKAAPGSDGRVLTLRGTVIMGAVEIKN